MNRLFRKNQICTWPNLLSLVRLLLIPVILWLYIARQEYRLTLVPVIASALTDVIDGKIARKYNMISDLGKILDPVADKLTQAALLLCLTSRYPRMWVLLMVFAVKELIMLLLGYLTLRKKDSVNSARWHGKLSTVLLYGCVMLMLLIPDLPVWAADGLITVCIGAILLSLALYVRFYISVLMPEKNDRTTSGNAPAIRER